MVLSCPVRIRYIVKKSLTHGNRILKNLDTTSHDRVPVYRRCKNGIEREILFRSTLSNNKQCVVYEDVTANNSGLIVRRTFLPLLLVTRQIPGNKNSQDHETIPTPGIVNDLDLTNALKMARDYIAILDLSGKCLWANETMTNAMDPGDHGDLGGRNFALCIAPEIPENGTGFSRGSQKNRV